MILSKDVCIGSDIKQGKDRSLELIMNKLQVMSADIEELKVKSIAPKKTFADMFENTPRSSKRIIKGDNGGDNNVALPQRYVFGLDFFEC
jgi:hypothetical protein